MVQSADWEKINPQDKKEIIGGFAKNGIEAKLPKNLKQLKLNEDVLAIEKQGLNEHKLQKAAINKFCTMGANDPQLKQKIALINNGVTRIREFAKPRELAEFAEQILESVATGNVEKMKSIWKSASSLTRDQAVILSYSSIIAEYLSNVNNSTIQEHKPPKTEVMQQIKRLIQGTVICSGHLELLSDKLIRSIPIAPKKLIGNHSYDNPLTLLLETQIKKNNPEPEQVKRLLQTYAHMGHVFESSQLTILQKIPQHGQEYYDAYKQGENLNGRDSNYLSFTP